MQNLKMNIYRLDNGTWDIKLTILDKDGQVINTAETNVMRGVIHVSLANVLRRFYASGDLSALKPVTINEAKVIESSQSAKKDLLLALGKEVLQTIAPE